VQTWDVQELSIEQIQVDPNQPRKDMVNIGELSSSIIKQGLIYPIEVQRIAKNSYIVIDGERRLRAYKLLKRKTIPCIIKEKVDEIYLRQAVSDFHKEKLSLIEQASVIQKLEDGGKEAEEIQHLLGIGSTKFYALKKVNCFNDNTRLLISQGKLTLNQIHAISQHEIISGKEDEIIEEIVEGRKKSKYQIDKVILRKQDVRMIINTFLSDAYFFEKKLKAVNEVLDDYPDLVDLHVKQHLKETNENLDAELEAAKAKIGRIQEYLKLKVVAK
jgi:hypothetical protein